MSSVRQADSSPTAAATHEVIYLTGAPAAGKSTLSRALSVQLQPLAIFEYGQRLTAYLAKRSGQPMQQEDVRAHSSAVATIADIKAVDRLLLEFVAERRQCGHVLIDTHAVTKESYGFRITAYSLDEIAQLRPTMVVVLYTAPDIAVARIGTDPGGRPMITPWEAGFHTTVQASVAVAYATSLGVPVYLLDGDRPADALAKELAGQVSRRGASRSMAAPNAGAPVHTGAQVSGPGR